MVRTHTLHDSPVWYGERPGVSRTRPRPADSFISCMLMGASGVREPLPATNMHYM